MNLAKLREGEIGVADWPLHMAAKNWVDISAFLEAFERAAQFVQVISISVVILWDLHSRELKRTEAESRRS